MIIDILHLLILGFLICAALAVHFAKDLLAAVIIFASYSSAITVLWLLLMAPDIALTEAAIGAGVTTILFLAVISRTRET